MGMFLYIEKRTCRMGQQPQQQVRFLLVRVNHGMMVQYERRKATVNSKRFFDSLRSVALCRNAFSSMAAPSVSRRSRQRQGVVSMRGKENGGLDFIKAAVM